MTLLDVEQSVRRVGAQRPRLEAVPPHEWSAADEAIELMALAGKPLDEWQEYVLEGAMGERADGKWTAFEVGLVVPRQCGKNVCIEARELAGLFLLGDRVIIHSAHQFKTARKSFRDMERLIRYTPDLYSQVLGYKGQGPADEIKGIRVNGGEMSIELENGNKLEYQARSKGGGRGFTGDLIVLDEAYDLSLDEIAAMLPTMAARSLDGNPQIWYTSSAGMPDSHALSDLRERGMAGDGARLAYFEWSAADSAESGDADAWYQANPGLGIRISEEYIRETEFASMGDEQFRRERLGIWAQIGGDSLISDAAWRDCLDVESQPGERITFALDVPPARDTATIAMCSIRADGVRHVEVVDRGPGTHWVPARMKELQDRWSPAAIIVDEGGAAGSLIPDLKRQRVRTTPLNLAQYARACGDLYDAVAQKRLAHLGQPELNEAVASAQRKDRGDSLWTWNRRVAVADISPLVAVTLAWHGATLKDRTPRADAPSSGRVAGRKPAGRTVTGRGGARASGNR